MVAEKAAKSISDIQNTAEDEESSEGEDAEEPATEKVSDGEKEKLRKSALDKLENVSEDTLLGQASIYSLSYWL